ncbi:Translation elongation/initiation factor/Ribosomal beta-barrel [Penicillium chrysogenum]|nr:Translation elongation/initiation factor/Ribosomal beta-barrel [Penicillium chrysogenum]
MSFRGRGNASGANRGGFGGGRGGENFPTWMRCEDVKGANEIFLLQVAEASSSHSAPPAQVLELGSVMHSCEGEMVCESVNPKIPYFNAPIYLENKTQIGKVDEILGPINQVYFTVKPQDGIVATSFKAGDKVYIGGDKLLPLEKFLPKPKPPPGAAKPKRAGGAAARGRGGFGAPRGRGGRGGAPRGRGGFGGGRGGGGFSRGGGGGFSRGRGAPRGGGGFRGRGY